MTCCPSCGRYVGSHEACPHCGAALKDRTSVRLLKLAALVLAVGGLGLLWLLATQTDVPCVEIGQANAMMNLAYVRVAGLVTRPPSYDPDSEYFSFWLADDTGELHVAAYRDETRAMIAQGRMPALGDRVTVEGTLRVREDFISLTINVPAHLEIQRDAPVDRAIGSITAADALTRVRIRAQVRALRVPYSGLTLVRLRDNTDEIDMAISEVASVVSGDLPPLAIGQSIEVTATVSLYKDTPQLSLSDSADLTFLGEELVLGSEVTINQVSRDQTGEWVTISGEVTALSPFSAGVRCTLDDGTGQVTLLLWQENYDRLTDPSAIAVGATLRVQGVVAEYRGELEIVPELPLDIEALAATPGVAPSPTAPATALPEVTIGDLNTERLGQTVQVTGYVRDVASFSRGFEFTLDDGTGQMTLLTWHDIYDSIARREGLRNGALVRVTGKIGQFENEMQITPARSEDVAILAAGNTQASERDTGSLTLDDVGGWVTVEGEVRRAEPFSSGVRVHLDDGSGELPLLLWRNVLDRVTEGVDHVSVGNWMRVTGKVDEYQGTLEIVPALPSDLALLPSPVATPVPTLDITPTPDVRSALTTTVPIGQLDSDWMGEVITVTGQVIDTASFAEGFKFTLDDGSGQIVLLMWHDVYDTLPDAAGLNLGATVTASGEITEYEGALQIEPDAGTDVEVTVSGNPFAPPQAISALAEFEGQRLTIVGQVRAFEETSSGARLFVGDETGEVLVFIWSNVLARIADSQALRTPGTRLRITGTVQAYRGDLEIVPALPYDVEVLR